MQFTKTLLVFALPLLAMASPTPSSATSNTARDTISMDLAAVQAARQILYDAYGQSNDIAGRVDSAVNSLRNQWTGSAATAFQHTVAQYQESQAKASEALLAIAEAAGGASDSYKEADSDSRKLFD